MWAGTSSARFSSLAANYHGQFQALFPQDGLEAFWDGAIARQDPRLEGHPCQKGANWKKKTFPLFLHGDGVEYQDRDTLMVWSWGGLMCLFQSLDCHFLIADFPKSCTTAATWDPLMKWLEWSLTALAKGFHPKRDPWNRPLPKGSPMHELMGQQLTPSGMKGIVWCIQGDHEFFSNVLRLPHWSSRNPCWECNCTQPSGPRSFHVLNPDEAAFEEKVFVFSTRDT